jgi:poly-D-alanine transfer protein DltD
MENTTTQQERKTYNGWTNYATWRISLEWFDNFNVDEHEMDAYELSLQLREYVENTLEETTVQSQIVLDYALAFTSDVNWYEIAEHLINEQNS